MMHIHESVSLFLTLDFMITLRSKVNITLQTQGQHLLLGLDAALLLMLFITSAVLSPTTYQKRTDLAIVPVLQHNLGLIVSSHIIC